MLGLIILSIFSFAFSGLVIMAGVKAISRDLEITPGEYILGLVLFSFVIAPVTSTAGYNMAKADLTGFSEYWGGWEINTRIDTTTCYKDGSCRYTYQCEPYTVQVSYQECSGSGDDRHCETKYRNETRYHSCPYVNAEYTYVVSTTLGDYVIGDHMLPANPDGNRWRDTYDFQWQIPSWVISQAGTGIPPFWQAAKDRVDSKNPGPATKVNSYNNYILAADFSLLQASSPNIERFSKLGILPSIARPSNSIYGFYWANKVYFVNWTPADPNAWHEASMRFNGAFGSELQGDLHLVIINSQDAKNEPDAYVNALKAYWQNPEVWGDDTFAKNGYLVVIGTTDGLTVDWARATTGMPEGNYESQIHIRNNSESISLTPAAILGNIKGEVYVRDDGKTKVRTIHTATPGFLEKVLFGLDEVSTKFIRVSMSADDPEDIGSGFLYLDSQIEPKDGQKHLIVGITFVIGLMVWFFLAAANVTETIRDFFNR